MKEKINIIKRKNILILLFLNIIIISLILSMITKIEVKQINIGMVKKELNTNVDIEKIWDSSRLIKQNIKNNNDNKSQKNSDHNSVNNKNKIDLNNNNNNKEDNDNKNTEENKTETNTNTKVEIMPETSKTRLLGLRDSSLKTLEKYRNEYRNSIIYGTIAYILHMLSLISIPIVVILLIVSYVYDSVIGLKTRSLYNKGRLIRFHVLTFFVACQLMPLIFATVIKGWGN